MRNIFFFCDSQKNILTAYFMFRIYYCNKKEDWKSYLLVSDNSPKSVACAERIKKSQIWDDVMIVYEANQDEKRLLEIGQEFDFRTEDEVYLFALQNRFARVLYEKAYTVKAQIKIVDEGIRTFDAFLDWKKMYSNEMLAGIDVETIDLDGWCYEPRLYQLPSNIHLHRIELQETLQDKAYCEHLREEVRNIFAIEDEEEVSVVYFDQYFTLYARTTGITEQYLIKKVASICGEDCMVIKPHPMERGFVNKYSDIDSTLMTSQDSPWEAVYFVNYYGKTNQKVICLAGESTAPPSPCLMFGDKNYVVILLWFIYKNYIKPIDWNVELYFQHFAEIADERGMYFYAPRTFYELNEIIESHLGKSGGFEEKQEKIDRDLIFKLNNELLQIKQPFHLCAMEIWDKNICVETIKKEQVIAGEEFSVTYIIPEEYRNSCYQYRWKPVENCFLGLDNVKLVVERNGNTETFSREKLVCEYDEMKEGDFVVCQDVHPSYLLIVDFTGVNQITIKGIWNLNCNLNRIRISLEQKLETEKQNQKRYYEKLLDEKKSIVEVCIEKTKSLEEECTNMNLENGRLENECTKMRLERERLESEYTNMSLEKERLEHKNGALSEQNEDLQTQIDLLYNTVSWKITKPLRMIKKKMSKHAKKLEE